MEKTFGEFLKQKRQEKNLTQRELAKILFVSESAVSKWEKDVAHPDITLLPKLSSILNITEHELITASIDNKAREEKSQAKKWRTLSLSWNIFFYIAYILTLIPCFICNLAIDKSLSWFWIVVSALLLAFTFTNLPKLIKKNNLILQPLSNYIALCLLLGVCCIYTNGNWFWISSLSILFALVIIFLPIYISKYKIFEKIRHYNDFISIAVDFVILNILLISIDLYCVNYNHSSAHWFFPIALPITTLFYLSLNILLAVRFFKINKLLKTSIILILSSLILYIPPIFIKNNNPEIQQELNDLNILKASFSNWQPDINLEQNIHCIIFLTLLIIGFSFLIAGLAQHIKSPKKIKITHKKDTYQI